MPVLKNLFLYLATRKARRILGSRARILALLAQAAVRWKQQPFLLTSFTPYKKIFFVFNRMLKAYAMGEYKSVPWKSIISIAAVLIYFISPLDFIPDFIPLVGIADDFGLLVWVYRNIKRDVDAFLQWEQRQIKPIKF